MGRISMKSLREVLDVVALAEVEVDHLPRIMVRSDVGPPHLPRSLWGPLRWSHLTSPGRRGNLEGILVVTLIHQVMVERRRRVMTPRRKRKSWGRTMRAAATQVRRSKVEGERGDTRRRTIARRREAHGPQKMRSMARRRPNTRGLMEKAKRHPGKLLRSGLEQMSRFMNTRSGDDLAPSVSWREQRVNAYLNQVLFNQHPASSMGMRNARELVTLATCIDLLMEEQFASLGDVLMQRLKAVEASLSEGWSVANFQELIPPPKATLTSDQERAFAARHALQQRKLATVSRKGWARKLAARGLGSRPLPEWRTHSKSRPAQCFEEASAWGASSPPPRREAAAPAKGRWPQLLPPRLHQPSHLGRWQKPRRTWKNVLWGRPRRRRRRRERGALKPLGWNTPQGAARAKWAHVETANPKRRRPRTKRGRSQGVPLPAEHMGGSRRRRKGKGCLAGSIWQGQVCWTPSTTEGRTRSDSPKEKKRRPETRAKEKEKGSQSQRARRERRKERGSLGRLPLLQRVEERNKGGWDPPWAWWDTLSGWFGASPGPLGSSLRALLNSPPA